MATGFFWVTRSKESLCFRVVKKLPKATDNRILSDELVVLKNKDSRANYGEREILGGQAVLLACARGRKSGYQRRKVFSHSSGRNLLHHLAVQVSSQFSRLGNQIHVTAGDYDHTRR